jgi:TPR repeat protein
VPLLIKDCEGGDGESCQILADLSMLGEGVPKSEAEEARLRARSTKLYGESCEAGDGSACFMYGGDLLSAKDNAGAFKTLTKGCDLGDPAACGLLGGCYDEGVGVAVDKTKAMELWKKSCDGGNAAACSRVGR